LEFESFNIHSSKYYVWSRTYEYIFGDTKTLKRILRYIKGTIDFDLFYGYSNCFELVGYNDNDWAEDMNDEKSITGFFSIWETHHSRGVQRSNS
jgi:hypothetical protein